LLEEGKRRLEWLADPTIWVGLATLVILEIVLGIDNLIFIAILAQKLPAQERDHARRIGLGLALFMRLGLLASISWMVSLTRPLFTLAQFEISWRDIILIAGGAFLLIKATIEIHDRLEGPRGQGHAGGGGRFWPIVAQIVVLDLVFSIDSVITAVGMVDELAVMMVAVVIAVILMMFASGPLTRFINAHPSLVILCLGFLLMVGFVLVVDGLGYHLPKGYLYAAIGFSVLIEAFNQTALRNRLRAARTIPMRDRTADAVLRLLGGVPLRSPPDPADIAALATPEGGRAPFTPAEQTMVRGVLSLAERPVQTIMTPRTAVKWIDAADPRDVVLAEIRDSPHRLFPLGRGSVEDIIGIVRKEDVLNLALSGQAFDLARLAQEPAAVREAASILEAFEVFRSTPGELALVVDEYGGLVGIVTRTDLLQAIAGHLPETTDEPPEARQVSPGVVALDASMSIYDVQQRLQIDETPRGDFHTLAGFVLARLGRVPAIGDRVRWHQWILEVAEMDGWRISNVVARRQPQMPPA
jgi:predicted tellurium resistance membrane protein TerC/Mg2+/Co2+ transporter CorC